MTSDELEILVHQYRNQMNLHNAEQMALKYFMNSIYGVFSNVFFACYDKDVAETITTQGQDMINFCADQINRYFHNFFHKDKKIHEKLGITHCKKLDDDVDVVAYIDTDSVEGSTLINCVDDKKIAIEDMFKMYCDNHPIEIDGRGNEILDNKNEYMIDLINYDHKNKSIVQSKISKLVRHKVTKDKWKIISNEGDEIITTGDHSVMIIRDGELLSIKPKDIVHGDRLVKLKKKNA